jgi:hypothetical protein
MGLGLGETRRRYIKSQPPAATYFSFLSCPSDLSASSAISDGASFPRLMGATRGATMLTRFAAGAAAGAGEGSGWAGLGTFNELRTMGTTRV